MKRHGILAICTLVAAIIALGTHRASAYESYHDPGLTDDGYCASSSCHPWFTGGGGATLHNLHNSSFVVDSSCSYCHTNLEGRDNPLTLWSWEGKLGSPDLYGCAGCHGRDYGETVEDNYRGFDIAGLPKMSGYGLRSHHAESGVALCAGCHGESSGGILAENVAPPYYESGEVALSDPCDDGLDNDGDLLTDSEDPDCGPHKESSCTDGLDNDGDGLTDCDDLDCTSDPACLVPENEAECADGLDNDGDGFTDCADSDCAGDPGCQGAPVPDISLSSVLCHFPDTEVECAAEPVVVTLSNVGTADLTVSSMTCSSGTDFSVDVNGGDDPCGSDAFTLAPGGSCTVAVTFCPLASGDLADTLTVASDDPDEPSVAVSLTGSGFDASGDEPPPGGSSGCSVGGSRGESFPAGGVFALLLLLLGLLGMRYVGRELWS